jgi:hypothetical protein
LSDLDETFCTLAEKDRLGLAEISKRLKNYSGLHG